MNQHLRELYKLNWESYKINIQNNPNLTAALPFLISVPPTYEEAPYRIMFCGQETQGWGGDEYGPNSSSYQSHATIDSLMKLYDDFVNTGGYNSPYWNFQKRIALNNPDCGFICNNIVKIGKANEAGCDEAIDGLTRKYFSVFKDELKILRPNLIIILSGNHNYDNKFELVFGQSKKISLTNDFLFEKWEVENASSPLILRLNHPRAIQQRGHYFKAITALNDVIKTAKTKYYQMHPLTRSK